LFDPRKDLVLGIILVVGSIVNYLHETDIEQLDQLLLLLGHVSSVELHEVAQNFQVLIFLLVLRLVVHIIIFLGHKFLAQILVVGIHH
jgi:hypothetical protein